MGGNTSDEQVVSGGTANRDVIGQASHLDMERLRDLVVRSGFYDAEWYAANNPDVAASGLDPLDHFILHGGREGRSAGPFFDSTSYLAYNVDVARASLNPLIHHLETPGTEKRYFETVEDFSASFGDDYDIHSRNVVLLIAKNGIFEPDWFDARYPHVAQSGINPIVYLVRHGFSERLSPSPDFDAGAYLDAYLDVAESCLNPVLHYLLYGQSEGRASFPVKLLEVDLTGAAAKDLALIAGSPFFDEAWYLNSYPDVARAGIDPALHYLQAGGQERRRPSLFFDPSHYLEQVPYLAGTAINPLLHYIKIGRETGLAPAPLADFAPPSRRLADLPGGVDASLGRDIRRAGNVLWTRYDAIALRADQPALHFGQTFLGIVGKAEIGLAPLTALSRLLDIENRNPIAVRVHGKNRVDQNHLKTFGIQAYRSFGAQLTTGHAILGDCWFTSDVGMAIRFGSDSRATSPRPVFLRAFQVDLAALCDPVFVGEGVVNPSGLSIIELALDNSFAPIVLCLTEPDGTLIELGLLPFPSLVRGGHHHAELVALSEAGDPIDNLRVLSDALVQEYLGWDESVPAALSLSDIRIDLQGAVGIEPVFSSGAREWLTGLFGLRLTTVAAYDVGTHHLSERIAQNADMRPQVTATVRPDNAVLDIPADALPTLSAIVSRRLTSRNAAPCLGAYVLADMYAHRPRWSVVPSREQVDLLSLQPAGLAAPFPVLRHAQHETAAGASADIPDLPLAVRYRLASSPSDAVTLVPRAPDTPGPVLKTHAPSAPDSQPSITAIVLENALFPLSDVLAALGAQTLASGIDIILVSAEPGPALAVDLHRLFPYRHRTIAPSVDLKTTLGTAAALSGSSLLLVLDGTTILHDARTLETLHTMVLADRVASASCALLSETVTRKGHALKTGSAGYFPSHVSLLAAPRLILSEPDAMDALPAATYPVMANSFGCMLVRKDLLLEGCARHAGVYSGNNFALHFGLSAIVEGHRHLCTTAVRATRLQSTPAHAVVDPLGLRFVRPGDWERLLSSATLLRDIRS